MNWQQIPMGTMSYDEILNLLISLELAGGCDRHTLRVVAQAVGIRLHFDQEVEQLERPKITVERPGVMLLEVK